MPVKPSWELFYPQPIQLQASTGCFRRSGLPAVDKPYPGHGHIFSMFDGSRMTGKRFQIQGGVAVRLAYHSLILALGKSVVTSQPSVVQRCYKKW